jgi:ribonuclease D
MNYQILSPHELVPLLHSANDFLIMDTEFDRATTHWPELCLIQLATHDGIYIVDPKTHDMNLIFDFLRNSLHTKVFHSSAQDIDIFNHLGVSLSPLFDSQIAAHYLGFGRSISYNFLVKHYLNVTLDKTLQKSQWAMRPLSDEQLLYAANDVIYLRDMYPVLKNELIKRNLYSWFCDDMNELSNGTLSIHIPSNAGFKCENQLGIFHALKKWREMVASSTNKPKSHILSNELLTQIVLNKIKTKEALEIVAPALQKENRLDECLTVIMNAAPVPLLSNLTKNQHALFKVMKKKCARLSKDKNIEPMIIATPDTMMGYLKGIYKPTSPWRKKIFWDEFIDVPTD